MLTKKDPAFIQSYLEDSSNIKGARAEKVVIPESVEEVSSVLKEANSDKTPVTISGARTGQSGGSIPFGGIVLSTEKLNAVKDIRKFLSGGRATVEPAVLIEELKEKSRDKGLFYTYDPTEQTAFVGGTIATNASGARSFRYGPTRKYVKALTLVLADGAVLALKRGEIRAKGKTFSFEVGRKRYTFDLPAYRMPLAKSSAGYYAEDNMDLVDLFVGQEGTLGVIVGAELLLLDRPGEFFSCFAFFTDEKVAWDFAGDAQKLKPVSIEYFDRNSLEIMSEKYANVPRGREAAIFFEDEIAGSEDVVLERWEKALAGRGVSADNTHVAMSEKARREFLNKRHFVPERMNEMAKGSGFPKVSTDLAVPREKSQDMLNFYKKNLKASGLRYFMFGHIGDAHLHVNILPSGKSEYDNAKKMEMAFAKKAVSFGGTVSAEHGIGKRKKELLKLLYGDRGVREMRSVKKALDPNLILGRGNIFDG